MYSRCVLVPRGRKAGTPTRQSQDGIDTVFAVEWEALRYTQQLHSPIGRSRSNREMEASGSPSTVDLPVRHYEEERAGAAPGLPPARGGEGLSRGGEA